MYLPIKVFWNLQSASTCSSVNHRNVIQEYTTRKFCVTAKSFNIVGDKSHFSNVDEEKKKELNNFKLSSLIQEHSKRNTANWRNGWVPSDTMTTSTINSIICSSNHRHRDHPDLHQHFPTENREIQRRTSLRDRRQISNCTTEPKLNQPRCFSLLLQKEIHVSFSLLFWGSCLRLWCSAYSYWNTTFLLKSLFGFKPLLSVWDDN